MWKPASLIATSCVRNLQVWIWLDLRFLQNSFISNLLFWRVLALVGLVAWTRLEPPGDKWISNPGIPHSVLYHWGELIHLTIDGNYWLIGWLIKEQENMPCYEGDRFYDRCMTSKTHTNWIGPGVPKRAFYERRSSQLSKCPRLVPSLIHLVMVLRLACTFFLPHR